MNSLDFLVAFLVLLACGAVLFKSEIDFSRGVKHFETNLSSGENHVLCGTFRQFNRPGIDFNFSGNQWCGFVFAKERAGSSG